MLAYKSHTLFHILVSLIFVLLLSTFINPPSAASHPLTLDRRSPTYGTGFSPNRFFKRCDQAPCMKKRCVTGYNTGIASGSNNCCSNTCSNVASNGYDSCAGPFGYNQCYNSGPIGYATGYSMPYGCRR